MSKGAVNLAGILRLSVMGWCEFGDILWLLRVMDVLEKDVWIKSIIYG